MLRSRPTSGQMDGSYKPGALRRKTDGAKPPLMTENTLLSLRGMRSLITASTRACRSFPSSEASSMQIRYGRTPQRIRSWSYSPSLR